MDEARKTDRRNSHGVKDSCDQYRSIDGAHFVCWMFGYQQEFLAERARIYRRAGVRCRRIATDLYIHDQDRQKAAEVDASIAAD